MIGKFFALELFLFVLGVLGCHGLSYLSTRLEPWTYVGQVSGVPTEIFYETYKTIYVRTSNGETFSCDQTTQTCVIDAEARDFDRFPQSNKKDSLTPFAPGNVVASSAWEQPWGDYVLLWHIIGLDDGRIWIWAKMPSYSFIIGWFIYVALSFLLGILFLIGSLLRRLIAPQKQKNDAKHAQ